MLNLLFDLIATQPIHGSTYHGGGKYAKKVFLALLEAKKLDTSIIAIWDGTKHLDKKIEDELLKNGISLVDIRKSTLANIVKQYQVNRIYSALPLALEKYGLFQLKDCRVTTTIHGLRFLEIQPTFKDLKYISNKNLRFKLTEHIKVILKPYIIKREKQKFKKLIDNTDIIAVSDHTKYAIKVVFPELSARVPVFYSPDISDLEDDEIKTEQVNVESDDFFLMVSGDRWLKNNLRSAIALDNLFSKFPSFTKQVIVTGVKDPSIYLKHIKNQERFSFLGYVSENMLKELNKRCYALLYMSLNEGFGYPPLEAMKYGRPTIASPHTSIPEICGDSVLYANPYSILEIENRILKIIDEENYTTLQTKALQRFNEISIKQKVDLERMVNYLLH